MKRGWFGDSWRHSLSAKGVKTGYFQKRLVKGSISRAAFAASDESLKKRAVGAGRDVTEQAKITEGIVKRPLTEAEQVDIAKQRAEQPRSSAERQARLDVPLDREFESKVGIPQGSFTSVRTKKEGKFLGKKIKTDFMNESQGKEALAEINRKLAVEQARGTNPGRTAFLQEARREFTRKYGSGPEKQRLRDAQKFGEELAKRRRSTSAKKGASTRKQKKEKDDLSKDPRFKEIRKQIDEMSEVRTDL
jgi:hypothetical protein